MRLSRSLGFWSYMKTRKLDLIPLVSFVNLLQASYNSKLPKIARAKRTRKQDLFYRIMMELCERLFLAVWSCMKEKKNILNLPNMP